MNMSTVISFKQHYQGAFTNMLRWEQLDKLWKQVQVVPVGWYIYWVGKEVPTTTVTAVELNQFIVEMDALLRREHEHDYCGIVYVDDPTQPQMIKIFDPNHLGSSCGSSGEVVPPGWILTKIPPESILTQVIHPANRKRWWQRLFPIV